MQGGFEVRGVAGVQEFVEKAFATVEALAGRFPLLFEIGYFVADGLDRLEKSGMCFNGLFVRRIVRYGDAGLSEKLLEESVHSFEAIRIARVIAQQHVVLKEKDIIFAAIEKDKAVLAKLVVGSKILAKQGAARLGDGVVFDFGEDLGNLLSHAANDRAPGGL